MVVRVKSHLNPGAINKKIIAQFQKTFPKSIKKDILNRIASGNSPVAGKGRFEKYSDSYKKQIKSIPGKQVTPVNLKVTGKMLKSLLIRNIKNGISIIFTDPVAAYHDLLGAGRSKTIRRLLPGKGEKFYQPIQKKINDAAIRAIKKVFKN